MTSERMDNSRQRGRLLRVLAVAWAVLSIGLPASGQGARTCPAFGDVFRSAVPRLDAVIAAMQEQGFTGNLSEHTAGFAELVEFMGVPSEQALKGPAERLRAGIHGFRVMSERWPDYTEAAAAAELQLAMQNVEGAVEGFRAAGCDLATAGVAGAAATPSDQGESEEWQTIASWSGNAARKETETFTVPVGEWRLRWRTEPREGGGGLFAVNVYNAENDRLITQASSEGAGEESSFVRAPAGSFYITLGSSLEWQLWVERRR